MRKQNAASKIKAGIFDGPQIRQLVNDSDLVYSIYETEAEAWTLLLSADKWK